MFTLFHGFFDVFSKGFHLSHCLGIRLLGVEDELIVVAEYGAELAAGQLGGLLE